MRNRHTLPSGGYPMGPADALRAVKLLEPKVVVPIHYNTFDHIRHPHSFARRVEAETPARVVILGPGESYRL